MPKNTDLTIEDEEDKIVEVDDDESDTEDTDDGGAMVKLKNEDDQRQKQAHFANIVDEVDQADLQDAVTDLLDKVAKDKDARQKRDKLYEEGLRRTGLGDDAPGGAQFTGSTKVVHPMLVEACVDFSSRVMKEIFPPGGPVKSKILGEKEKDKVAKAERKTDFMNWQTTEQMPEFRGELEQLSTQLPLGGAQYLKLMWSAQYLRPCAEFIPIDDVYLPFAATNFYSAERKTHVQYVTEMEYRRRVKCEMYIDVDLGSPEEPEYSKASIANDKIEGRKDTSYNEDGLRTIFEIYTHLDFGDGVEPYIISIDKTSSKAVALYRNWEPEDPRHVELDWIVEFPFVPWRGAYPIGLTHMIGGLSGAATGALRALLDSAHIQNIPTLLKLKGGPGGQTLNVQPTEVVELEGGALIDDVRKLAMPLPFNGPSPVLFQLLGFVVDAGKGVVQTSFEKLSDANQAQPVGTTMALIEQGMVVFSSIHSRIHSSMSRVFKILHRINSAYLTIEDIKAQASGLDVKPEDFDGPMDVVPVSDPAIFSETQRFAQTQALMQRSATMPQMYDQRKIEQMFLRSLKISADDVLQPAPGTEDVDPASENVAAAMGTPVYVLPQQDHVAHLKTHLAFLKSPLFGQNPAIVKTYMFPMATHLRDHLLNYYLSQAHEAVDIAQKKNLIEKEAEQQVGVILKVQEIIEQQLNGFGQELAQIDQAAQQFKPQPPMPPDSSMQIAQMNAQLQGQALQQRTQLDQAKMQQAAQLDQAKMQLEQAKMQQASQVEQAKMQQAIQSEQVKLQLEQAKLQLEQAKIQQDAQQNAQKMAEDAQKTMLREQAENERTKIELQTRYQMNTDDNNTALRLAATELATGEKFAVSTGTGINPGA